MSVCEGYSFLSERELLSSMMKCALVFTRAMNTDTSAAAGISQRLTGTGASSRLQSQEQAGGVRKKAE